MYIRELILRGFKSFGKKTEINLVPGVNGIVGPNGSGKSNIFDSIQFVMGGGSAQMRAKKGEDLLYIGRGAKMAEVLMHLNGNGKMTEVGRALNSDGTSKYSINGRRRRREDVLELFGQANVESLYSVISQGEIERIVRMSDLQRRKIIDDIAGITEYEEKKQKALQDLEEVRFKLSEVNAVLRERETVLDRLKVDREAALKYIELEKSKKRLEAGLVAEKLDEMTRAKESIKNKIVETEGSIIEIKRQIEETNKKKINLENKLGEIEEKMRIAQGEQLLVLVQELEAQKSRVEQEKGKITDAKKRVELNKKRMIELDKFLDDRTELEKVQKAISIIEKEKVKIDNLKKKYFGADKERYEKLREDFEKIKLEVGKREEQERLLEEELERIDSRVKKVEKENREAQKEKEEAKEKIKGFEQEKAKLSENLQVLIESTSRTVAEISGIKPGYEKKRRELDELIAQGTRRLTPGARQVLASGKAGQLGGVVGMVGDLFECDEKYQAALEVAAGTFLMSVVVEKAHDAARAIEFLRAGKIGRVSFIPLDKIQPKLIQADVKNVASYPGVLGFAVELAKFNKKLDDVFRFVFSDTLVVSDLDTANRIGIGRARMVTLTGDLCERSGLMVGGFYQPTKSAGKLEKEVLETEARLAKLEATRDQNNQKIVETRQTLAEMDIEIERLKSKAQFENMELKLLVERENEIKTKLKEVGTEELKKTCAEIEAEIKKIKPVDMKELEALDKKSGEISASDRDLKLQLQEIQKEREKFEEEKEGIIRTNKEFGVHEADSKTAIEMMQKNMTELEVRIQTAKQATSGLFVERQKFEEQRIKLEKEKLELYQKFGSLNEDLKNTRTSIIGLEHETEELARKLKEFDVEPEKGKGLEARLVEVSEALSGMGPINLKAAQEYELVYGEVGETIEKKKKLNKEKRVVIRFIEETEKNKKESFMNIYTKTKKEFEKVFTELLEGEGRLLLENRENPFDGGLIIEAKIHGKKIKIQAMSGGEKSLTALSFIFALQSHTPSPFYLFDEVDAALDKINSEKLVQKLKNMVKESQVLVITHNDQLLKACNQLIGVYMREGNSEIVSVKTVG